MGTATFNFSKSGGLAPAPGGDFSTFEDALDDAGAGFAIDTDENPASNSSTGWHVFPLGETTGLDVHFAISGTTGETAIANAFRVIPVRNAAGSRIGWTFRHLGTIALTASSQAISDTIGNGYWATVAVSSDAGLAPLGTRAVNGTTTTAAGSLWVDPLCAGYLAIQTSVGTADSVGVYAMEWTAS